VLAVVAERTVGATRPRHTPWWLDRRFPALQLTLCRPRWIRGWLSLHDAEAFRSTFPARSRVRRTDSVRKNIECGECGALLRARRDERRWTSGPLVHGAVEPLEHDAVLRVWLAPGRSYLCEG